VTAVSWRLIDLYAVESAQALWAQPLAQGKKEPAYLADAYLSLGSFAFTCVGCQLTSSFGSLLPAILGHFI